MGDTKADGAHPAIPLGTVMFPGGPWSPSGIPGAILPKYETAQVDAPVELYAGGMELLETPAASHGSGTLRLHWTPRPTLRFNATGWDGFSLFGRERKTDKFRIDGSQEPLQCHIYGVSEVIEGRFWGRYQAQAPRKLTRVAFHLPNWPRVCGTGVAWEPDSEWAAGRVVMEADGWRVFLDPVRSLNKLERGLNEGGAFAITYVGQIERADGSAFDSSACDDLLEALQYFLSFARGFWTPPTLPVAFDEAGSLVHADWQLKEVSYWRFVHSWFTDRDGLMLGRLLPGFLRLWKHPVWSDPLRRAIWWYISANTQAGGCDGAVILAQVALELLAWIVYVEEGHILSTKGFDDLVAADKLRLLLAWMKLDLTTPRQLTALAGFGDPKIPYGPYKLVEVRNALVHPKNRNRLGNDAAVVIDAWQLSLWYVELAILRACNYVGPYVNRLSVRYAGEVEPVPWT